MSHLHRPLPALRPANGRALWAAVVALTLVPGTASANAMGGYGGLAVLLLLVGAVGVFAMVMLVAGQLVARRERPGAAWPWLLGVAGLGAIAAGVFCLAALPGDVTFGAAGLVGLAVGVGDLLTAARVAARRSGGGAPTAPR